MLPINEYRKRFPQYNQYNDRALSRYLYSVHGDKSGMSFDQWDSSFRPDNTDWEIDPKTTGVAEATGRQFVSNMWSGAAELGLPFYKIGAGIVEDLGFLDAGRWIRERTVDPIERRQHEIAKWGEQFEQDKGRLVKGISRLSQGFGQLAPTLPADIYGGKVVKGALNLSQRAPSFLTGILGKIPAFGYGMGMRKATQGSVHGAEEGGYVDAAKEAAMGLGHGIAEGTLMHMAGTIGAPKIIQDLTSGVEMAQGGLGLMGRLPTQMAAQAGVITGLGTAEKFGHTGNLPTLDEVADMAIQGAGYGLAFTVAPVPFEIATKKGPRVVSAKGKDAVFLKHVLDRYGTEEISDVVLKPDESGVTVKLETGREINVEFTDDPYIPEDTPIIDRGNKVVTTHRGRPAVEVRDGRMVDPDSTEMPVRTSPVGDPSHVGESTLIPEGLEKGETLSARRSMWEPDTEMDPRDKGTAGVPELQAPKPTKLKTNIVERTLPTIDELRAKAAERYGVKKETPAEPEGPLTSDQQMRLLQGEPEINASGESAASLEAIRRARTEGERMKIDVRKPNEPVPIPRGVDAIDQFASDYEIIVQKGAGKDPNAWTITSQGNRVGRAHARQIVDRLHENKRLFQETEGPMDPEADAQTFLDMFVEKPRPEDYPEIAGRGEFSDILLNTYGPNKAELTAQLAISDAMGKWWIDLERGQGRERTLDEWYQTIAAGGKDLKLDYGPRGGLDIMKDGRAVFYALNKPDVSTAIHEIFHVAKEHLNRLDPVLAKIMESEFKVEQGMWTDSQNEQAADHFERYLMTGKAPTPALEKPFARLKNWMLSIYKSVRGIENSPVSPEMTRAFSRMLGAEREVGDAARDIVELTNGNGGATYNLAEGRSIFGDPKIAVGVFPGKKVVMDASKLDAQAVMEFIETNREILNDPKFNVGTWIREDGKVVMDISVATDADWKAVALAKAYDQEGTFNLETEEYRPTGGKDVDGAESLSQVNELLEALEKDEPVTLVRFMNDGGLDEVDPSNAEHRSRVKGAEERRLREDPDSAPRMHYYFKGGATEPNVRNLQYQYETEIPKGKLYDWAADINGYRERSTQPGMVRFDMNEAERMMIADGYWGYHTPGGQFPSTVAVFEQLPVREVHSHNAVKTLKSLGVPADLEGVSLRNLTPEAWNLVGKMFGINEPLGPINELMEVTDGNSGKVYQIPGGIDGKFSWLDMFWLKSQGYNPAEMSREMHAAIQKKFSRTMEAGQKDPMQVFNNLLFAQLSPNAGLTTNQMAYSRLRAMNVEQVKELGNWIEKLPDHPTKADRRALSNEMRNYYGLGKVKADEATGDMFPEEGQFGIGYSGTQDLTYVAEFARLFEKNPEWFIKGENEGWYEYTERISSQVPGIGTKVAAFGAVWQDPVGASIGAIDRHMIRELDKIIFTTKKERREWTKKMVEQYNRKKKVKDGTLKRAKNIRTVKNTAEGRKMLSTALLKLTEAKKVNYRQKNGEYGKKVPQHLRDVEWIEEPSKVAVTNPKYILAMNEVQARGAEYGMGAFSSQHMIWDQIRNRLEPHEALFPGLYKLPKMSLDEIRAARLGHAKAGYFPEGDRPVDGGVKYDELLYWQGPPENIGELVVKDQKSIRDELTGRISDLGFDDFQHMYNDGKVAAKVITDYQKRKGLNYKDAKSFQTKNILKYREEYLKVLDEFNRIREENPDFEQNMGTTIRDLVGRKGEHLKNESYQNKLTEAPAEQLTEAIRIVKEQIEIGKENPYKAYQPLKSMRTRLEMLEREANSRDIYDVGNVRESFDEGGFYPARLGQKMSPKERRIRAMGKAHMQNLRSEAPPPKGNKGILQNYTDFVDTVLGEKLLKEKLIPLLEKVPYNIGEGIVKAFKRDYRGSLKDAPEYVEGLDEMRHHQDMGKEYAHSLGDRLVSLGTDTQVRVAEMLKGERGLKDLPADAQSVAEESHSMLLRLGRQAVDAGLLSEEVYFENYGKYFPRLYDSKEYNKLLSRYGIAKPNQMDMSRFMKRKDIPAEIRKDMGEIMTAGYPVARAIGQLTHDIEMARFFQGIAQNRDWSIPMEERWVKGKGGRWKRLTEDLPDEVKVEIEEKGFKQLPNSRKLGALREAYVHEEIYKDLNDLIKIDSQSQKVWRKSLGWWKWGKVVASPKTHMRNVFSNSILAHLGGMPMYEQPKYLVRAFNELKNPGEVWAQAKHLGLLDASWAKGELEALFRNTRIKGGKESAESVVETVMNALNKVKDKTTNLYEFEEQWFKLAKMMHNIERRGMQPKEAAKDAEKWLFDYSKLTRFQEKYRSSPLGAPFATFTFKALPRIAEAAVKTPWRFALPIAMMKGIEGLAASVIGDTKEEKKAKEKMRPEWMQGGLPLLPNFVRFPITDKHGREYWLNLTYMMPWGDIGESGGAFGIPGALMPFTQPFTKEAWQQVANYDTFWKKPIVPEYKLAGKGPVEQLGEGAKERMAHIYRTMVPTIGMDIGKFHDALANRPDYKGRERAGLAVALDTLAGIKTYPVDYLDEFERQVMQLDPKSGIKARELKGKLKSMYRRRAALEDMGRKTTYYDKKIEGLYKQLNGLGEQLQQKAETFSETGI